MLLDYEIKACSKSILSCMLKTYYYMYLKPIKVLNLISGGGLCKAWQSQQWDEF